MVYYYNENRADKEAERLDSWEEANDFIDEVAGFWIDYFEEQIELIFNFRSFYIKLELYVKDMKFAIVAIF